MVISVVAVRRRLPTWTLWLGSTMVLLGCQFLMRNVVGSSVPPMGVHDWVVAVVLTPIFGLIPVVIRALVEVSHRCWPPQPTQEP